ncbi:uncharacterized protein LOC107471055 [Arachis duranensis]|uniref:Uncharacterized protein LOC107471055 n=1 Tax=Arachis duranensis TaxID=130453 RepID=A0A6P5MYE8_ARADU|nr:uncharacterized protein LOC107471055 [Arachis duranensis]
MATEESFVVLVHPRGSIKRKTRSGVKFTDKDPLCMIVRPTTRYEDLVSSVLLKLGLEGVKQVKKFFYRIPITVFQETVKYDCFTIGSDEDLQVMFHCRRQFPEVRTPELLAKLVDVVSSSGGSNRNTTTLATVAGSSSRPAVASSSVPAYEPPVQPVASPSFAVDLNGSCAAPAGVGDEFLDDPEDDDVESDMIADDSGDDVGASEPAGAGGGSSSGTQQYPPYFFSLDLDAMRQEVVPGQPAGFGARDSEGSAGLTEFQVGQQFQDKDEALLSVKTYGIRRGIQYKVVESDYRRDDASVSIKVLLNATAAHFGFRPTYRRVWLAKQKAVALIYGDWNELYNELPMWVLGVQLTMLGTVGVLRTSPVRVGAQLDESQAYFHRLFWTFPPCIEDGNSNILPVAFALVEGENAESWAFFFSHLREHVTPQPGLLVILDRHNGIKAALEAPDGGWLPPSAYRTFCIRHVAANFALTFKGKDARRLLVNAAYAKTEVEFHYWFDILRV